MYTHLHTCTAAFAALYLQLFREAGASREAGEGARAGGTRAEKGGGGGFSMLLPQLPDQIFHSCSYHGYPITPPICGVCAYN